MTITTKEERISSIKDESIFVLKNGVYVADAVRSVSRALVTTGVADARDVMDYHRFMAHTNELQTRATAKIVDTVLIGARGACDGCSTVKAHRTAVPKKTTSKSTNKGCRLVLDLSDPQSEKKLERITLCYDHRI